MYYLFACVCDKARSHRRVARCDCWKQRDFCAAAVIVITATKPSFVQHTQQDVERLTRSTGDVIKDRELARENTASNVIVANHLPSWALIFDNNGFSYQLIQACVSVHLVKPVFQIGGLYLKQETDGDHDESIHKHYWAHTLAVIRTLTATTISDSMVFATPGGPSK